MASPRADTYVDVTATFDKKLSALRAHVSQEVDRDGGLETRLRGWLGQNAAWRAGRRAAWPRRSWSSPPAEPGEPASGRPG